MSRTSTALRWCHSHAQLADMMTKLNGSTQETWRFFRESASWKLVYDPEFVSAKRRAMQGLTILEDGADGVQLQAAEDPEEAWEFMVVDLNDAWLCVAACLRQWSTSLAQDDPKDNMYYHPEALHEIRRNGGASSALE